MVKPYLLNGLPELTEEYYHDVLDLASIETTTFYQALLMNFHTFDENLKLIERSIEASHEIFTRVKSFFKGIAEKTCIHYL